MRLYVFLADSRRYVGEFFSQISQIYANIMFFCSQISQIFADALTCFSRRCSQMYSDVFLADSRRYVGEFFSQISQIYANTMFFCSQISQIFADVLKCFSRRCSQMYSDVFLVDSRGNVGKFFSQISQIYANTMFFCSQISQIYADAMFFSRRLAQIYPVWKQFKLTTIFAFSSLGNFM
jgi:hypothetical protein